MSKLCMKQRENKRVKLCATKRKQREELRAVVKSLDATLEEKEAAQKKLQTMPRDSNYTRINRRCWKTGRSRGVLRVAGLCMSQLRQYVMNGYLPGFEKASW